MMRPNNQVERAAFRLAREKINRKRYQRQYQRRKPK